MLLANFNRKEHLRHRAVSLRQHGFLVKIVIDNANIVLNVVSVGASSPTTKCATLDDRDGCFTFGVQTPV